MVGFGLFWPPSAHKVRTTFFSRRSIVVADRLPESVSRNSLPNEVHSQLLTVHNRSTAPRRAGRALVAGKAPSGGGCMRRPLPPPAGRGSLMAEDSTKVALVAALKRDKM